MITEIVFNIYVLFFLSHVEKEKRIVKCIKNKYQRTHEGLNPGKLGG